MVRSFDTGAETLRIIASDRAAWPLRALQPGTSEVDLHSIAARSIRIDRTLGANRKILPILEAKRRRRTHDTHFRQ